MKSTPRSLNAANRSLKSGLIVLPIPRQALPGYLPNRRDAVVHGRIPPVVRRGLHARPNDSTRDSAALTKACHRCLSLSHHGPCRTLEPPLCLSLCDSLAPLARAGLRSAARPTQQAAASRNVRQRETHDVSLPHAIPKEPQATEGSGWGRGRRCCCRPPPAPSLRSE